MCIVVCMAKQSQLSSDFTEFLFFFQKLKNYCNDNPDLKWAYHLEYWVKSHDQKTAR